MANPRVLHAYTAAWLITCLLVFQPDIAVPGSYKMPVSYQALGRKVLSEPAFKQGRLLHPEAVAMQHSVFLMDPGYIPKLKTNKAHVLIQLTQALTKAMQADLQDLGVVLQEYIPRNTWKAVISSERIGELQDLPWVRAMGDILAMDKMPTHLMEQHLPSIRSNVSDDPISLQIAFYEDIPFERAREIAGMFFNPVTQGAYISGNRLRIMVPAARLEELARYDEVRWIEAGARFKGPANCDAARLSSVDHVQSGDYELDGHGVVIGQWDSGAVDSSHPDLSDQVTIQTHQGISDHATGVAGTLVGRGACNATGMAPEASLYSFDFSDDVPSKMGAANYQLKTIIANHSWGYVTGWQINLFGDGLWGWCEAGVFGCYTAESAEWDRVIRSKGIISVNAAGNDRDDKGVAAGTAHRHKGMPDRVFYDEHPADRVYGCISDVPAAKNVITVGAVDDDGRMTEFSSWGPTNDGRIKPDLVANGVGLTTTDLDGEYAYNKRTGTSYATPVVSGAVALLVQAYRLIMDMDPSPAMVKALLVNTADDLGETGPDYQHGWGLMNLRSAVKTVNAPGILLNENHVSTDMDMQYTVYVAPDVPELKVTVAWSDMKGSPGAGKALVNDIDLEISDPEGFVYQPWVLDMENPADPAGTGINSVDNVEQVLVPSPQSGEWIVRVKGTQIQDSQEYAVVSNLSLEKVVQVGTVFRVDDGSKESQTCPVVSSGKDALFLVAWRAWNIGEEGWDVYGQFFYDTLEPWHEEFKVNTLTTLDQIKPAVATLSDGSFVIVWDSLGQDDDGFGVFGQRYLLNGTPIGDEFKVNGSTQNDQKLSAIAALESGGFVVTWASQGQDGSGSGVFAQMFRADGIRIGDEFQVNTFSEYDQSNPSVAALMDGGFVIAWQSQNQDGDDWGVYGQCFDSRGQRIGTEFQLNTTTRHAQHAPVIQAISNSAFLAIYTSAYDKGQTTGQNIHGQRFSYDGNKVGKEFQVNSLMDRKHQDPEISVLEDGGFMVTWITPFPSENRWEIQGQLFNELGIKTGGVFQVARYTDAGAEHSSHSVDRLSGGKYVVIWCHDFQVSEYKRIYGQQLTVIDKPYIDISADDPDNSDDNNGCMVDLLTK